MIQYVSGAVAGMVTAPAIWYYIRTRTTRIRKARSA